MGISFYGWTSDQICRLKKFLDQNMVDIDQLDEFELKKKPAKKKVKLFRYTFTWPKQAEARQTTWTTNSLDQELGTVYASLLMVEEKIIEVDA